MQPPIALWWCLDAAAPTRARRRPALDDTDPRPPHVRLLVAFTNSVDVTEGTDDITTPAELSAWLGTHGLADDAVPVTADDLALALRLRAALHEAFEGHHDGVEQGSALADVARDLPLRVVVGPAGPALLPVDDGVRGALARVLVAVGSAGADGTWVRLKICAAGDCSWTYYDASKNRSRAWCEYGCGNKVKTRAYRARRKSGAGVAGAR